jgi:hypothetical protein
METRITIDICPDALQHIDSQFLAAYWHAAQVNPAADDDRDACRLVESIGREIIRRWLAATPPALWVRQGVHAYELERITPRSRQHESSPESEQPLLPDPPRPAPPLPSRT